MLSFASSGNPIIGKLELPSVAQGWILLPIPFLTPTLCLRLTLSHHHSIHPSTVVEGRQLPRKYERWWKDPRAGSQARCQSLPILQSDSQFQLQAPSLSSDVAVPGIVSTGAGEAGWNIKGTCVGR